MIDFSMHVDNLVGFVGDVEKAVDAAKQYAVSNDEDNQTSWAIEVANNGIGHDGITLNIYSYDDGYNKHNLISFNISYAKHYATDGDNKEGKITELRHLNARRLIQALEMAIDAERYDDGL